MISKPSAAPDPSSTDAPEKLEGEQRATALSGLDAILLDLDGVVTTTARVHAAAWKNAFDEFLEERAARRGGRFVPFDLKIDYPRYVDGKPRFDGVASFLQSRAIALPWGSESDSPDRETVCGLGNRKNHQFLSMIRERGVGVFDSSVAFIRQARARGLKVAVVTSSRNCKEILRAADLADLFDATVDGVVAREWMLQGKPAPDTYLEAARRLGVPASRAAVIEDATAGIAAGRAGHFRHVIGVDRGDQADRLRGAGADFVVADLAELTFADEDVGQAGASLPLALDCLTAITARMAGKRPVVFLDYDGTLTPIVDRPEQALLSREMRRALENLAARCTVVVISGRERGNVERLVGLEDIVYAGAHGFDISGPAQTEIRHQAGLDHVTAIRGAAAELERLLGPLPGVLVEDKIYAVAVHFRLAKPQDLATIEAAVDDVLARHPGLRKTGGKKIFELRPDIDWDKGKAVLWLLDALDLGGPDVLPLYLGDDVTDYDAFRALRGRGLSFLVSSDSTAAGADYRLADTGQVRTLLEALAANCPRKTP